MICPYCKHIIDPLEGFYDKFDKNRKVVLCTCGARGYKK